MRPRADDMPSAHGARIMHFAAQARPRKDARHRQAPAAVASTRLRSGSPAETTAGATTKRKGCGRKALAVRTHGTNHRNKHRTAIYGIFELTLMVASSECNAYVKLQIMLGAGLETAVISGCSEPG